MPPTLQPFERAALYELYLAQREELLQALAGTGEPRDPRCLTRLQESVDRLYERLRGQLPPGEWGNGRIG
ncbi:hypothetical protein [Flaviaesturariibacter amylovorans]|uniref:Uncharacterized protein n=1 Tax=Flaviaesturariibacter amylovorans TaxID=1084520 RepID=A0ABP8HN99_9BACT